MGRSKNRKTRSITPNHRLRSDSNSYRPSPESYSYLAKGLRSSRKPSPFSPSPLNRINTRGYVPGHLPSAPRRSRSYSPFSQGVWTPAFEPVRRETDKTPDPSTLVCVRRQQRREVLHALRKTGKSGQKSPVYNRLSKIHCKK